MAESPTDILNEVLADKAELRAEIRRLRSNIANVRTYAEEKSAQFTGESREFRRGMATAYGDMARKLVVAAHVDFNRTEVVADEPREET
jgi:iron uptake system EfeUOB component EfeO/EfeM